MIICIIILFFVMVTSYGYIFFKYWNAPILKVNENISEAELGVLEGKIKDLSEVIVIADIIEKPTKFLFESVVNNLNRQVKYKFLISKSSFQKEKTKYFKIFEAIAQSENVDNLVEINPLRIDWEHYPCIFYKLKNGNVFAFMGNEKKEGIAGGYDFVGPNMAFNLLKIADFVTEIKNDNILTYEETKQKISLLKINLN